MTVTWHVHDLKISHNNLDQVKDLLTHLEKLYGEKFPVSRGKKYTYMNMDLDFSTPGVIKLLMESYIMEIME